MSIFLTDISGKMPVRAERGAISLDTLQVVDKLVQSFDHTANLKKSYTCGGLVYNIVIANGEAFMCVCDESFSKRICFAYLDFVIKNNIRDRTQLKKHMEFYSNDPKADKIKYVQGSIDEVKGIMLENIDKILERGEKIEDIEAKTDDLMSVSSSFRRASRSLKCALIQQNMKLTMIIILIVLFMLIALGLIIYLAYTFSK